MTIAHWRCASECVDPAATIPVALANTLASEATWNGYFGSETTTTGQTVTTTPLFARTDSRALYTRVTKCDEVWTIGHGRPWHTDTRETRLFQSATYNPDTGTYDNFADTKAIRPAHEMCMYVSRQISQVSPNYLPTISHVHPAFSHLPSPRWAGTAGRGTPT